MTTPIITVENLSKRYHLGQIGATTLRESVERWVQRVKRIGQRAKSEGQRAGRADSASALTPLPLPLSSSPDDLWALRDVSFEVQPGEVLGIIGRNGAGKSTLLKILSRITEPTSGRAVIRGRVASLLEVGTGFHPELSGRENIFLNGAILGMRHAEIAQKFDEIVAFAEVERFIDTPVKRYSSGMYVRLAFAVAAHLDPEILLVDEVLAVGDAEFQSKCMGKMGEVAKGGRTVLFISHNMAAIRNLCGRCVYIKKGQVADIGTSDAIVDNYLADTIILTQEKAVADRSDRAGSGLVRVTNMSAYLDQQQGNWVIKVSYNSTLDAWNRARLLLSINTPLNQTLTFLDSACFPSLPRSWPSAGVVEIKLSPDICLSSGDYLCNVACLIGTEVVDHVSGACHMRAPDSIPYDWRMKPMSSGSCYIRQSWTLKGV